MLPQDENERLNDKDGRLGDEDDNKQTKTSTSRRRRRARADEDDEHEQTKTTSKEPANQSKSMSRGGNRRAETKGREPRGTLGLWGTLWVACIQGAKVQTIYYVDRGIDEVIYDERKGGIKGVTSYKIGGDTQG